MEAKASLIEPLLERAEEYGKISFELLKLKSIDKTADVTSALASRLLLVMALSFFALTLNLAIALWIGEMLGKIYFGFFIVAIFYGIVGIVLYFMHPSMKAHINNLIIRHILN